MAEVAVKIEHHANGGSIWVWVTPPVAEWVCVWSTAPGNVGQYLAEVPSASPTAGIKIPLWQ